MAKVTVNSNGWTPVADETTDVLIQRTGTVPVEITRSDVDPGAGVKDVGVVLWEGDPHISIAPKDGETRKVWARSVNGETDIRVI